MLEALLGLLPVSAWSGLVWPLLTTAFAGLVVAWKWWRSAGRFNGWAQAAGWTLVALLAGQLVARPYYDCYVRALLVRQRDEIDHDYSCERRRPGGQPLSGSCVDTEARMMTPVYIKAWDCYVGVLWAWLSEVSLALVAGVLVAGLFVALMHKAFGLVQEYKVRTEHAKRKQTLQAVTEAATRHVQRVTSSS